jgi:signal transduction histidine kinase
MTDLAGQPASVPRWQRRLLPGELVGTAGGRRSARVVDVLLFLFAAAGGILIVAVTAPDHNPLTFVLDVAFGAVACATLFFRRSRPVAVALYAVPVSALSAMAGPAALVTVFNAAIRASPRALAAITALAVAALVIFPAFYPSLGSYPSQVIFCLLATIVVIGWGLFTRARRELISSLHERAERLESEQRLRVEQAREAERRRIAREMHDVLAHRISLLSVHAGALEFHPDASPEEVAEAAGVIRATAQSAMQELREVIGVLRDEGQETIPEPPQPTLAQLPALMEESRAAGMNVRWRNGASALETIPPALGRTAYRVVQEGLTNARKHATGAAVEVTLDPGPPLLLVVTSRRAVGAPVADPLPGAGTGLVGLGERVALAGGRLDHGPGPNGDFVLRATLPWTP